MPEAIESRAYRAAARANCIQYQGLLLHTDNTPALAQYALVPYAIQSPEGAISQLMSTLVNMDTQIERLRKGLRMGDAHPVPGVSWGDARSLSMSLSGDMYFENRNQYQAFVNTVTSLRRTYGWVQTTSDAAKVGVYRPNCDYLSNVDPVQAAIKGMVMSNVSEAMDAGTVLTATDAIQKGSEEEKKYFAARDRLNGGSMFATMAIEYYSNSPLGPQNQWQNAPKVCLLIDGAISYKTAIGYIPTSLSYSLDAWVVDDSGGYPTCASIQLALDNPLGGFLANFTNSKDGATSENPKGVVEATRENYMNNSATNQKPVASAQKPDAARMGGQANQQRTRDKARESKRRG